MFNDYIMDRSSKAVVLGFTVLSSLVRVWKIRCSVHRPMFIKPEIPKFLLVTYTVCPRRNVPDFGSVFLMLMYTDITHNTYVQS